MPNYRLTLAYDGTEFAGSQVQPKQRTVQGELENALGAIAPGVVRTTFAGRTDRGVHAAGQVAAITMESWTASERALERALGAWLPRDLGVMQIDKCAPSFNPRFDAAWREYRYWIAPGIANPFLGRYAWFLRDRVDPGAVSRGAAYLLGTHDFASFAGRGEGVPWSDRAKRPRGSIRTILACECREVAVTTGPNASLTGPLLEIQVAADGFLPRMVRNIVGALVEVGQGRETPEWIGQMLAARDRRAGSVVAPANGLTLWKVGYGNDELEDWTRIAPQRA
jgi:tRNA pseudouridine38-40 synthase